MISGFASDLEDGRVAVFSTDTPFGKVNMNSRLLTGSLLRSVTDTLALAFETKMPRFAFGCTFALSARRGHS